MVVTEYGVTGSGHDRRHDGWLVFVVIVLMVVPARPLLDVLDLGLSREVESLLVGLVAAAVAFTLTRLRQR